MRSITRLALVFGLLVSGVACSKSSAPTVESKSQTTRTSPTGTETTRTHSEQVGSTLVSATETKTKTDKGSLESESQTVVGTVTKYEAGKSIEVLTGDSKSHSFDLTGGNLFVNVDAAVTVGSKVKLVQRAGTTGYKTIEVTLEAPA